MFAVGFPRVRKWKRKRQYLGFLGVTETHSRREGWQFAALYTALESGGVDVEGKAMLVPTEGGLIFLHKGAANTNLDVVVQLGDVDRLRLVPVYPCRSAHHVVLLCMSRRG